MVSKPILASLLGLASSTCNYPSSKVGSIHGHCWHIYEAGAGTGISERNCGDAAGDVGFVFPRGFDAYYQGGHIAMVHWGVTKWGQYTHCNHAPGSTTYHCDGPFGYQFAGQEQAHTPQGRGVWYSFPVAGHDKQWSSVGATTKGANCGVLRIHAKCLFNLVAKAGRCPGGCDGKSASDCANCFSGVSGSQEEALWKDAFNGKCPFLYDEEGYSEEEEALKAAEAFEALNKSELVDPHRNLTWGFWRTKDLNNDKTAEDHSIVV